MEVLKMARKKTKFTQKTFDAKP